MNKGDFVGACLPYVLIDKGSNRYSVMTYAAYEAKLPEPASLGFTIPSALQSQLQSEGMVFPGKVLLYNDSTDPTASQQNLDRYLAVLAQLVPINVTT